MTPEGWSRTTVGDATTQCDYGLSCGLSAEPVGTPILRMGNLFNGRVSLDDLKYVPADKVRDSDLLRPGDLLLNRTNSAALVGKVGLFTADAAVTFASYLFRLRTNPSRVDPRWFAQVLGSPGYQAMLRELATPGVSQTNINREVLRRVALLLPPLPEQRKIAAILSSVDDAIESTQAVIDQLGVVKQAMMAELLTRGIPGRHTRFKQTEIGELPEQWQVLPLGRLAELQAGFPFKSTEFVAAGDRLLRGSNVGVGKLDWSPAKTVFFDGARRSEVNEFVLGDGDIILAMDRPFISEGFKVARVHRSDLPALLLQRVGRLRRYRANREYVWSLLHSHFVQGHLRVQQKGTDLPHISKAEIESCKVPLPDPDEQTQIATMFGDIVSRMDSEEALVEQLAALKSALMSVLLTGEVRVQPDESAS